MAEATPTSPTAPFTPNLPPSALIPGTRISQEALKQHFGPLTFDWLTPKTNRLTPENIDAIDFTGCNVTWIPTPHAGTITDRIMHFAGHMVVSVRADGSIIEQFATIDPPVHGVGALSVVAHVVSEIVNGVSVPVFLLEMVLGLCGHLEPFNAECIEHEKVLAFLRTSVKFDSTASNVVPCINNMWRGPAKENTRFVWKTMRKDIPHAVCGLRFQLRDPVDRTRFLSRKHDVLWFGGEVGEKEDEGMEGCVGFERLCEVVMK